MFLLYWDAKEKMVKAMNGSGRSPSAATLDAVRRDVDQGPSGAIPDSSAHAVTVPGAAAGWVDTVERFGSGKLKMADILAPAIELGEKGFPVSEIVAAAVSDFLSSNQWFDAQCSIVAKIREAPPQCFSQFRRDAQNRP